MLHIVYVMLRENALQLNIHTLLIMKYIQHPLIKRNNDIKMTYTQYTDFLCILTKHLLLSIEIYVHKTHLLHNCFIIVGLSFMFTAIYSYERFCLLCFKIWYSN